MKLTPFEREVRKLARDCRRKLAVPGVWGQGKDAGLDGRHCAMTVMPFSPEALQLDGRMRRLIGEPSIMAWNDSPERKLSEVLRVFERLGRGEGAK